MFSVADVRTQLTDEMGLVRKLVKQHGGTLSWAAVDEFVRVTDEVTACRPILLDPGYPNLLTIELQLLGLVRGFREDYLPPLHPAA